MKKNAFLSLVGVAALALCLTSCDKQSVLNTEVIKETSVVAGYVNIVKGQKFEGGVAKNQDPVHATGVKVILEIKNKDFGDPATEGVTTYETTVAADGTYRFEVKVNPKVVAHAVDVKIVGFEVSDYVWYKKVNEEGSRTVGKALYETIPVPVNITKGVPAVVAKQTLVATILEQ